MAVFKCKMCGGALEISENATTAECSYCGTLQTLPRIDNDKKANLYGRANHFRRNNEFDKASGIFEQLLEEDATDAEAYWSLVLCKYGIEYVEDPVTHKHKPTVNRTQPVSVFADENYKSAIGYASQLQKPVYEEEAEAIDKIQKQIMDISSKEEPFDVFICYKETDTDGRRTLDSVLANEMYNQLTQNGLRVFFARITLEDKIGSAYEPYIFSALNSARIMIVLGTKAEYFNAVWVKNEWSRYLAMIKSDTGKVLIPAYSKMDPYDLPEEFSYLQAQDMSRIGFMQDLVRGVKKILLADEVNKPPRTDAALSTAVVGDSKIRRIYMFLEDGEWQSADEYCEKVLDIDPECAEAYLGKLMAELNICERAGLANLPESFDKTNNYKKTIRFCDEQLKTELEGYIKQINDRIKEKAEEEARIANEKRIKYEKLRRYNALTVDLLKTYQSHTVGLKSNGTVVATKYTGEQEYYRGQCEVSSWRDIVAISTNKYHTVGLKSDGTVVATKYLGDKKYYHGQCEISGWCNIVAISAGDDHTVGLKSDSTVVATRYIGDKTFYFGDCDVSVWRDIVAIAAGGSHTIGLKSDGTMVATKYLGGKSYYHGQCDVSHWRDIIKISTAWDHTVGLKSDGTVVATKYLGDEWDYRNQCSVSDWCGIVEVIASYKRTVGLKSDGKVVAVGNNEYGQCDVSDWRDIVAISSVGDCTVGLKSDGTVVAVGNNEKGQCNVSEWRDIVAISSVGIYTVGLKSDGTVVAAGDNTKGQCNVSGWRLFNNIDTLETELKAAAVLRKQTAEQKAAEKKRIADERASRRASGVCQYCGGVFKGVFSKKCLSCGIEKDYQ